MVKIKKHGIVLEATNLEFESQAVLNPACIRVGNNVHMLYRAVRRGNYSSIGYCKLNGPLEITERAKKPFLFPEFDYEKHGVEDPRIVFIDGIYYLTYMAYNGKRVVAALATSKNLKTFEKKGPISYLISYADAIKLYEKSDVMKKYFCFNKYDKAKGQSEKDTFIWGKDTILFPKKINGKFAMLHRVIPGIQVIYFNDFKELTFDFWKEHLKHLSDYIILDPKFWFESRFIGAGCPPIETDKGWLLIYHAIEDSSKGRIYRAAAALLDKNDPTKVIGRLKEPLFSPEEKWELKGDVNNVVFPTGAVVFDETLYVYYGAADKRIAVASLNLNELLEELKIKKRKN